MNRSPRYPDGNRIRLYAAVARNLSANRARVGMSLPQVSEAIDVSIGQISKAEAGEACPLHVLVALAELYGVNVGDIIPKAKERAA